jgi:integrase
MGKARKEFTEADALSAKGSLRADPQSVNLSVRPGKTFNSYVVLVRAGGKQRWITIGQVGKMPLDEARALARTTVATAKAGPAPGAPAAPKTFVQVFDDWAAAGGRRAIRWRDKERRIRRHLIPEFGHRPFAEIERPEVAAFLDKIATTGREGKGRARMADMLANDLQVLEAFYAERQKDHVLKFRGYISKRSTAKSRKRVLTDSELRTLWTAAGNGQSDGDRKFGTIVKLLLLTLQRREKVVAMQWQHLNLERGTWTVPRDETTDAKGVPLAPLLLPPLAINLIRDQEIEIDGLRHRLSEFVFLASRGRGCIGGLSGYKLALEKRMGGPLEPGWVLHDLRRTGRTRLSKIRTTITLPSGHLKDVRVDSDVGEALLGHVVPGVRGIYDRPELGEEMGEALALLADHVAKIVGENIVSLVQAS